MKLLYANVQGNEKNLKTPGVFQKSIFFLEQPNNPCIALLDYWAKLLDTFLKPKRCWALWSVMVASQ